MPELTTLTLLAGDVAPIPATTVLDSNFQPVSLQGATVSFRMVDFYTNVEKVNAAAIKLQNDSNPATWGQIAYYWTTTDTDTPGLYVAWFIVDFNPGQPEHFPKDNSFLIKINTNP